MEDAIFSISLCLIFLLFAFKFLFQNRTLRRNLPPSPPSLPIIGHLHLLKDPVHRTLRNLSEKYGPVLSLRFGSRLVVIVSSPSAVQECFTKNDIVLANRPLLFTGKHLAHNHTSLALLPYGEHWRNLRRLSSIEIFSTSRLNLFLGIRRDEVNRLLWSLSHDSFDKVELQPKFSELTFNVIMRMVAGKRYYGDDVANVEEAAQFRDIMKQTMEHGGTANPGDFLPVLNWVDPTGFRKRVIELGFRSDLFLQELIDELRNSKEEGRNTMVDHLLSLQESEPDYYNDQIIKGLMSVIFLAGTDTAAVTLEWAMSNLLNNPDVLKKAKAELDAEIGQERLVEESDLPKLRYLQGILTETLRLNPAAPLLVPHCSSEDCKIEGYDVPRDTIVLFNAWAIHRDPNLWDEPLKFKPERHWKEEGESYKLMPFGLGRRACPGVGLAQRVVGLTLGSLIQCFEWERVGEEEVDMAEGKGLTMPKAVPLVAMCKARPFMNRILTEAMDSV